MKIPIRPLSKEIRTLFVKDKAYDYSGKEYAVTKSNRMKLLRTEESILEVVEPVFKVAGLELTVTEFAKQFRVPEIKSLEDYYPSEVNKFREYAQIIFDRYGLRQFQYQIDDLGLLLPMRKLILSYEQGMGKTLMSLIWEKVKRILNPKLKPSLIIVQQDLIEQWREDAFMIDMNLQVINKNNPWISGDTCITHYEYVSRNFRDLQDKFDILILDEAHKIKSGATMRSTAVRSIVTKYKIALTGTPFKNVIKDIHFLMGWLHGFGSQVYPYLENQQHQLKREFGVYEITNKGRRIIPLVSRIHELQYMLSPVIFRREISETGIKMVKKNVYMVEFEWNETQKKEDERIIRAGYNQTTRDYKRRLNTAIHPESNKLIGVQELVQGVLNRGEQVIVFSAMVPVHNHLHSLFGPISRIANGDIAPRYREKIMTSFKRGEFPILIAGLEALSSGHSFAKCNNVIIADFPWTATTLDQAVARVYRVVSEKDVNVFILFVKNSVDEYMKRLIDRKREGSEIVLDGEHDYEAKYIRWVA